MNAIKNAVIVALGLAFGYAAANSIGTVREVREGVDGAYFTQARAAVSSDGSIAAKVGAQFPSDAFNVDVLGIYTGSPSVSAAVLGDRFGVEGTLAKGKRTATLEGTALGCMAQGTLTSTDKGLSETVRVSNAQQLGNVTAQLGLSGTRSPDNAYQIGADVFLLDAMKVGKVGLFPYVGAQLGSDLSGYKYAGCVISPEGSRVSLKPTLGNGGNLTHINAYTAGLELRASLK